MRYTSTIIVPIYSPWAEVIFKRSKARQLCIQWSNLPCHLKTLNCSNCQMLIFIPYKISKLPHSNIIHPLHYNSDSTCSTPTRSIFLFSISFSCTICLRFKSNPDLQILEKANVFSLAFRIFLSQTMVGLLKQPY